MNILNEIIRSWQIIWKSCFSSPNIRVGENGFSLISGYMVFMERVK